MVGIPIKYKGRTVATVKDGVLHKTMSRSKDWLRKPPAIAFNTTVLEQARRAGAQAIEIEERDNGEVWRVDMAIPLDFLDRGKAVDRGQGPQVLVPLKDWTVVRRWDAKNRRWVPNQWLEHDGPIDALDLMDIDPDGPKPTTIDATASHLDGIASDTPVGPSPFAQAFDTIRAMREIGEQSRRIRETADQLGDEIGRIGDWVRGVISESDGDRLISGCFGDHTHDDIRYLHDPADGDRFPARPSDCGLVIYPLTGECTDPDAPIVIGPLVPAYPDRPEADVYNVAEWVPDPDEPGGGHYRAVDRESFVRRVSEYLGVPPDLLKPLSGGGGSNEIDR